MRSSKIGTTWVTNNIEEYIISPCYPLKLILYAHLRKYQTSGITKISRGYFRPGGGYFGFSAEGVYAPLKKPDSRLLALFRP